MSTPHREALARATTAQARHRLETAAALAAGPARKSVAGPDFKVEYDTTPTEGLRGGRFAPELADELAALGLPRRLATLR